ncbi:MAG: helix-turn-helix transcriptional regulator [Candidatus Gastranaerophilales bacterium]
MKELLGKRIKEIRMQKGFSQEQLAEMCDMSERNLSKIECGINFISANTLTNLTKSLNITPKELFDFAHLQDELIRKEELISAIKKDELDINLLYKIYLSIKK